MVVPQCVPICSVLTQVQYPTQPPAAFVLNAECGWPHALAPSFAFAFDLHIFFLLTFFNRSSLVCP